MRLVCFPPWNTVNTAVQYRLREPDMVVDPRPIGCEDLYKFKVTVNGTRLTINKTNQKRGSGWMFLPPIYFRVYKSNEHRYSFQSTKYLYHGLRNERAPLDTTEIIFKDGIETIRAYQAFGGSAFEFCKSLLKMTIPDSVKRIEGEAFCGCQSLQFIQLPPDLQYIGKDAFRGCSSLDAVFLPSTVTEIACSAFQHCRSLRILNISDSVERMGSGNYKVLDISAESLMTAEMAEASREEQNEWLRNRYNPLHNICCDPFSSPQAILQNIQGHNNNNNNELRARTNDKPQFTALHLLAANPSVNGDMITTYLQLAPDVAVMRDNINQTPLHMLCSRPYFSNSTHDAIRAYLSFKEGKEAAFMMDIQGKKPFQYLCEKSFDDMTFLKNKSFGSLFFWWFDCLEMSLYIEGAGANENTRMKRKFSGAGDDV